MTQWNARITAYDCMSEVVWTVKVWDSDEWEGSYRPEPWVVEGSLRGSGSDLPTKWLRSLLEDIREQM